MAITSADERQFSFESKALPTESFEVVDFIGEESISRLSRFEINLVTGDSDLDMSAAINQPATLTLHRGLDDVPFQGIVAEFDRLGEKTPGSFFYRVVLVPRLWLLSLNHQSRVFQNLPIEEIVQSVLQDSGFLTATDFRFELQGSYYDREYCVQYNESDVDFMSRLLEFEGIQYYFEHKDSDLLRISDNPDSHPEIPGDSNVEYNVGAGLEADVEVIHEFVFRERIATGSFLVRDYFYREPESFVSETSQLNTKMPGRRYEYGGRILDQSSGQRIARIRNEEVESVRRSYHGASSCGRLASGKLFSLEGHPRDDTDGKYLITRVRHRGSQKLALAGLGKGQNESAEATSYTNEFACIPAGLPYRPERLTPTPRISGIITAKVDSAGGDYAYVDQDGHYRVKLPFDLGDEAGGNASLPIPQSQINSGPDCGVHFPLHESNDLLLAFVDGDVDRPIAVGSLPNPTHTSPVTENNNAQNVIRTMGGNELVMDDTKNNARIWMKTAEGHMFAMDDSADRVVLTTTQRHQISFDDAGKFIEVTTKNGHFVKMDDANKKLVIQSKDGHRISINDGDQLITMVDESGDHLFQIDIGNKQLSIKTGSGGIELLAPGGLINIKAKELKVETDGPTSFKAMKFEVKADTDLKLNATNITAEAAMNFEQKGTNVTSEAAIAHKIKGTQVKSEGAATNDVQGAIVNVKATAVNSIQGTLVKIN